MDYGGFSSEESILETRALTRLLFGHLMRQTACLEFLVKANSQGHEAPKDW
jgi:hypothetical protein